MLALCVGAAALIVPTPVSLPTTFVTAVGVIENTNIIKGDMYKGGTDSLDLSSMLDTIEDTKRPEDSAFADAAGVARISEKLEKKMTPAEAQKAKQEAFKAKQAAQAAQGMVFPSMPDLPNPF